MPDTPVLFGYQQPNDVHYDWRAGRSVGADHHHDNYYNG
jgi:hypothetical protein